MPKIEYIDKYKVNEELGEGAFSIVYKAKSPENEDYVAVKLLKNKKSEDDHRFKREIRAIERLDHQNIVKVFDHGSWEGSAYYVMEYVQGVNPQKYFKMLKSEKKLSTLCKIGSQLCDALNYLHSQRIIHRDLKPENIMITNDGVAKILDFGLIKDFNASMSLTQEGHILGTPLYMAPEQIDGRKLDARADLYALGVIFYELLIGKVPFQGDLKTVLISHLQRIPRPPLELNPEIPIELNDFVMKLLEKSPDQRFQTAFEVKELLITFSKQTHTNISKINEVDQTLQTIIPFHPSFIDREREYTMLIERIENFSNFREDFIFLKGEYGVGKSRLIEESLKTLNDRDYLILPVQFKAFQKSPLVIFHTLLEKLLPVIESNSVAYQEIFTYRGKLLQKYFPYFSSLESIFEMKQYFTGSNNAEEKEQLFLSIAELLEISALNKNIIIILNDLHYLNEISRELLLFLNNQIKNSLESKLRNPYLLFIGGYDKEEIESKHTLHTFIQELMSQNSLEIIELDNFCKEYVKEFALSRLGANHIPDELLEMLYEDSRGSPYFLMEITQTMTEQKIIQRHSSALHLILPKETRFSLDTELRKSRLPVPDKIHHFFDARLAKLSDEERKILEIAACIGSGFEFDVLCSLITDIEEDAIIDILDVLLKKNILSESIEDNGELYDFVYVKFRDFIYDGISQLKKKRYHTKIGEEIENFYGSNNTDYYRFLAYHYSLSSKLLKSIDYLIKSADLAFQEFAYKEVQYLLNSALEKIKSLKSSKDGDKVTKFKAEIQMRLAKIEAIQGRFQEALEQYETAYNLYQQVNDTLNMIRQQANIGHVYQQLGQHYYAKSVFLMRWKYLNLMNLLLKKNVNVVLC